MLLLTVSGMAREPVFEKQEEIGNYKGKKRSGERQGKAECD